MKKTSLGFLSLAAIAAFAAPAHAQLNVTPFAFEVRGGFVAPTGDLKDAGVETGTTFGGNVTLQFMPAIGVYGGYTYNSFSIEDSDDNLVDQGFDAGVRLAIPTPLIPLDPYVKGGVVYHHIGGENQNNDSDNSLGFEVGAGLGIALGPKLSFTPQVTYSSYEPEFGDGNSDQESVSHVRVDVGLRLRL